MLGQRLRAANLSTVTLMLFQHHGAVLLHLMCTFSKKLLVLVLCRLRLVILELQLLSICTSILHPIQDIQVISGFFVLLEANTACLDCIISFN